MSPGRRVRRPGEPGPEGAKRFLDLLLVLLSLPLVLPVIVIAAVCIRLETPGSPFFLQDRVARGGGRFRMIKLRTMVKDAEHIGAGLYFEKDDPRFTQVGLFLRRFSLDELPQLFNVLSGDMSIVGPRPTLRMIVERYPADYAEINLVKPGLTGLSQVSGRNELTRSRRMALDKHYAHYWSVPLDLWIIARTFAVVLTAEGQRMDMSESDLER